MGTKAPTGDGQWTKTQPPPRLEIGDSGKHLLHDADAPACPCGCYNCRMNRIERAIGDLQREARAAFGYAPASVDTDFMDVR